jgi:hypothetical protein
MNAKHTRVQSSTIMKTQALPMNELTGDDARRERDVVMGIKAAAIGVFGACVDLEDSLDVLETRLARIESRALSG